jgi:hypothetical protein
MNPPSNKKIRRKTAEEIRGQEIRDQEYNDKFKVTNMIGIVKRVYDQVDDELLTQISTSTDEYLVPIVAHLWELNSTANSRESLYDLYRDENIEECFNILHTFKEINDVINFAKNPDYPIETKLRVINMFGEEFGS